MHTSNLWQLCRDRETLDVCTMDQTCMLHEHIQTEDNCATFHLHVHANSTFTFSQIKLHRQDVCVKKNAHMSKIILLSLEGICCLVSGDRQLTVWRREPKKQGSTAQCGRVPKKSRMCFSISLTFKPYLPFKSSQPSKTPRDSKKQSLYHTSHSAPALPQHPPPYWASHLGAVAFRRGTTIASVSHLIAWCLSDYWLLIMSLLQLLWLWQLPLPLPLPLYIIPIATTTTFTTTITMTMWMTMMAPWHRITFPYEDLQP